MMRRGWYLPYLGSKVDEYQNLYEKETDEEKKNYYSSLLLSYQSLFITLMTQKKGVVVCEEVSNADFLELLNDSENAFKYDRRITSMINIITRKFMELPVIGLQSYNDFIDHQDGLAIIGDFIKDVFGKNNYQDYKEWFRRRKSYILFDKLNDTPGVHVPLTNELFVQLPTINNIEFISIIAHEFGHLYRYSKNIKYNDDILSEYESYSYEIRILLWMIKNNIHKEDAIKALINLLINIEHQAIIRYFNNLYKLNKIKNPTMFEQRVENLKLLERIATDDMMNLFNKIYAGLESNIAAYLYSLISVINHLDAPNYKEYYNYVINNMGKMSNRKIMKNIGISDVTDLTKYQSFRKSLIDRTL